MKEIEDDKGWYSPPPALLHSRHVGQMDSLYIYTGLGKILDLVLRV